MQQNGDLRHLKPKHIKYVLSLFEMLFDRSFIPSVLKADVIFRCNNDTNIVTFTSIAYDARKLNNFSLKTYKNEEIPSKQLFLIPNQVCLLCFGKKLSKPL